ncbi:hypothetical protein C2E21_6653 [Chlorella sorokiniana]|uniref:Secretion-regulating guanine nucleotide exchange factor n=1 Tax=Chlorella sorokiniana TaxID=3076 RepID=A0A2P6TJL3_CHLSO|nr:hypothetical protein C2E21_6653 [Chlorella sorokiniana]|eukprot:PRW44276.1 hypothetical protein C2E21_6653 [Chlorella sorokiniana]
MIARSQTWRKRLLVAGAALLLCIGSTAADSAAAAATKQRVGGLAAAAAGGQAGGPGYSDPHWNWDVWYGDLKPYKDHKFRHDYWYQVPKNPRATVVFIHGCAHSGYNYFPQSEACDECRGLPEEMSHVLQALRRNYAVIAISSLDRKTGCFNYWEDFMDVKQIVEGWRQEWGMEDLPLYGVGISAGSAFLLKMPRYMRFDGLVSEALGVDPKSGGFDVVLGKYPPTVFISMERDAKQKEFIAQDVKIINKIGGPTKVIKVFARKIYPTYFSDRSPYYISEVLSAKIYQGLLKISMIDQQGNVLEDPRYTDRPWLKQLQKAVPDLAKDQTEAFNGHTIPQFPEKGEDVNLAGVWELVNLAYAEHEIISDYTTAAFMWFEGGFKDNFNYYLDWYTTGLPPPPSPPPSPPPPPSPRPPPPSPALQQPDAVAGAAAAANATQPAAGAAVAAQPAANGTVAGRAAAKQAASAAPKDSTDTAGSKVEAKHLAVEPADAATTSASSSETSSGSSDTTTTSSSGGGSNTVAIIAGVAVGAGVVLAAAGVTWAVLRRRRAVREAGTTMHTFVPPPPIRTRLPAHHAVPALPLRDHRIVELTEVIEQTGTPYSARRRKTAFQSDTPRDLA